MPTRKKTSPVVRYAVVGQGYIAQAAVLPAFAHARRNSRLVALISGDLKKRRELGRKYGVATYSYDEYETCLASGDVDAVYIALPNSKHREYAVRAAACGVHVLCEKPLAVTEAECKAMIAACRRRKVKLMTAYRLHFERATLQVLSDTGARGLIGEPRLFVSSFTMNVEPPNIRLESGMGGGTLYDIGIYCINAARHLFRAEPVEVDCVTVRGASKGDVEESASCILRFPGDRLATFTLSFGTDKTSEYRVVGTKGSMRVEPGYELASGLELHITRGDKKRTVKYGKRDQFAPELIHFSDCILQGREPAPSGEEGLADVRVIRALYRSARTGRRVKLAARRAGREPTLRQENTRPPVRMPRLVNATPPGG